MGSRPENEAEPSVHVRAMKQKEQPHNFKIVAHNWWSTGHKGAAFAITVLESLLLSNEAHFMLLYFLLYLLFHIFQEREIILITRLSESSNQYHHIIIFRCGWLMFINQMIYSSGLSPSSGRISCLHSSVQRSQSSRLSSVLRASVWEPASP